jgi:hypothetical protein
MILGKRLGSQGASAAARGRWCPSLDWASLTEMPYPATPIEDRFWSQVRKTPTCWLWTGACIEGYGVIHPGHRGSGVIRAHRLSYKLEFDDYDPALDVRQKCGNRACVRPDHLFQTARQLRSNLPRATGPARRAALASSPDGK